MLGKQPFDIVFRSGVARFDSTGNLFVNLPHSDDDPMPVVAAGATLRAPEKRARVHGAVAGGAVSGCFPVSGDLPRGLTVEVKGYTSASFTDGALTVSLPADCTIPDWFDPGAQHLFERPGNALRLWVKSSLPEGATLADPSAVAAGPPTQPKPVARAQFQPTSSAEPAPPAPETARGEPASTVESGPYRPERLAAGHLGAEREQTKTGPGCSTLALAVALMAVSLVALF